MSQATLSPEIRTSNVAWLQAARTDRSHVLYLGFVRWEPFTKAYAGEDAAELSHIQTALTCETYGSRNEVNKILVAKLGAVILGPSPDQKCWDKQTKIAVAYPVSMLCGVGTARLRGRDDTEWVDDVTKMQVYTRVDLVGNV